MIYSFIFQIKAALTHRLLVRAAERATNTTACSNLAATARREGHGRRRNREQTERVWFGKLKSRSGRCPHRADSCITRSCSKAIQKQQKVDIYSESLRHRQHSLLPYSSGCLYLRHGETALPTRHDLVPFIVQHVHEAVRLVLADALRDVGGERRVLGEADPVACEQTSTDTVTIRLERLQSGAVEEETLISAASG